MVNIYYIINTLVLDNEKNVLKSFIEDALTSTNYSLSYEEVIERIKNLQSRIMWLSILLYNDDINVKKHMKMQGRTNILYRELVCHDTYE